MATALETFRRIAPEFAADSDDVVNEWLADAVTEMDVSAWVEAGLYVRGAVYLAAHLMSVAKASAASASLALPPTLVSSMSEDKLSISYRDPTGRAATGATSLSDTPYGQEYVRLRKKVIHRGLLAE